jgi:hypothetical protein
VRKGTTTRELMWMKVFEEFSYSEIAGYKKTRRSEATGLFSKANYIN